jgi:predicted transposase/invertase (TIGR01784 family)
MDKYLERIPYAHDHFFKMMMADKRVAKEFFSTHLPPDLLESVDLECLDLQPSDYIDDLRKQSVADLLFKTKIADATGYLYLLVDHQSKPDILMPFRVLKYVCNIMSQHLDTTNSKRFPLVFPIVLYHGNKPWNFSVDLKDLVDAPKDLIDRYFLKPFQLIDLNKISDNLIRDRVWSGIMEFALKHIYARDMLPYLPTILEIIHHLEKLDGEKIIENVIIYLLDRGEWSDRDKLIHSLETNLDSDMGRRVMTLAEQWRTEGRFEQNLEIAKRLLSEGADFAFIVKITNLDFSVIEKLGKKKEKI